jgi:C4-dicarboxylate-specific signal transduction histidine kinase
VKREDPKKERLNINEVLESVLTLFRSEAIIRNVEIETDCASSLPLVDGDKVQLQQVILNIMMNAVEAMSEMEHQRRRVVVRTRSTDHHIQVTMRDFGPGIDPAKLEDIWQPFFTTKGTGLGMGLNISKSILQAHGGRIWAENNPDSGATFVIELPVAGTSGQGIVAGKQSSSS